MVPYYGDYPEDHAEIRIPFNTFSSNDPSASVTITNLVDADIEVHADGDTTQIATDGASVIIDFAGETGAHMILIDSSVDAAYTTATEYAVKIVGTTIDSATVNAWVGAFSIERAGGVLAFLKANLGVAGVAAAEAGGTGDQLTAITLPETGLDLILKGSTHTLAVADAVWDEILTGATHNASTSAGRRLRTLDAAFVVQDGTAQAGGAATITLESGASTTNDIYRGDRNIIVRTLAGDVNGSREVDWVDMLEVRVQAGKTVDADSAKADIDCSGRLTYADMRAVRPFIGTSVP